MKEILKSRPFIPLFIFFLYLIIYIFFINIIPWIYPSSLSFQRIKTTISQLCLIIVVQLNISCISENWTDWFHRCSSSGDIKPEHGRSRPTLNQRRSKRVNSRLLSKHVSNNNFNQSILYLRLYRIVVLIGEKHLKSLIVKETSSQQFLNDPLP